MDGNAEGRATIDLRTLTPAQREALFAEALLTARHQRAIAAETLVLRLWRRLRRGAASSQVKGENTPTALHKPIVHP